MNTYGNVVCSKESANNTQSTSCTGAIRHKAGLRKNFSFLCGPVWAPGDWSTTSSCSHTANFKKNGGACVQYTLDGNAWGT
ncbi:MAG: hypothetical protein IPM35_34065 [Myxococcales bacterium]|nr:hypothetical protein [Myxococcales bacterium]